MILMIEIIFQIKGIMMELYPALLSAVYLSSLMYLDNMPIGTALLL